MSVWVRCILSYIVSVCVGVYPQLDSVSMGKVYPQLYSVSMHRVYPQ